MLHLWRFCFVAAPKNFFVVTISNCRANYENQSLVEHGLHDWGELPQKKTYF
jgi:hypothetical protein